MLYFCPYFFDGNIKMSDKNIIGDQFEQLENIPVAIVDDQNDLLSVIVFCYENLFDWLTIEDLAALNLTCKQLQQLTSVRISVSANSIRS